MATHMILEYVCWGGGAAEVEDSFLLQYDLDSTEGLKLSGPQSLRFPWRFMDVPAHEPPSRVASV